MRLTRLNIKNFRTIEELSVNFPTHYSAICGKNDSGKTNVLLAIRSVFGGEDSDPFIREYSISFKEDLPQWAAKDSKERTIEITLELSVDPNSDNGLHSFLTTYLKLPPSEACLSIVLHSTYSAEVPQGNTWIEVAHQKVERMEAENVLQKLKSSSVILFHNSTDKEGPFYIVHGRRQFPIDLSLGDSEQLDTAKSKLNATVNRIAKRHQKDVEELLGRLKEKYKIGFSFPKFNPSEIPLSVTLGDSRTSVPLENWGSGTQNRTQILMTLFKARQVSQSEASATKITPILVIEEPEAFLHPSAQAEFGSALQAMAEEFHVQVIVTTHSPYMLNLGEPSSNLLLERRYEYHKMRETLRVDTAGEKWMEPFGLALGIDNEQFVPWKEAFFSKHDKLLLVEGETDKEYFELLRDSKHGSKALEFEGEIVSYGGKDSIKPRFLLNFIKNKYEKCFITFDLDAKQEIETCLTDVGFEEGKHYCAVGVDEPGKKDIEGLIPDNIRSAVYSANTGLVAQAMNGTTKERHSAKNKLKALILQEFKKVAQPGEEHYTGLYTLAKQVDKALS
jgi:predicted ATP-dependent endonuclease of OLD family